MAVRSGETRRDHQDWGHPPLSVVMFCGSEEAPRRLLSSDSSYSAGTRTKLVNRESTCWAAEKSGLLRMKYPGIFEKTSSLENLEEQHPLHSQRG